MQATDILQTYLDVVSRAVLTDDWDAFCNSISLPCHIITLNEDKIVTKVEDLKAGFDQFVDSLRAQRVTHYIRLVESATLQESDVISGHYITHLIAGSIRVMQPLRSKITLQLIGNRWCAVSVSTVLTISRWPLVQLEINPDTPPEGPLE